MLRIMFSSKLVWAGLAATIASAAASADPIATYGFTDLDGDYTLTNPGDPSQGGPFVARASAISAGGPYNSRGDVTRVEAPGGTAIFQTAFVAGADSLDYVLTMNIANVTATAATASGSFVLTDLDGDTITGDLTGNWQRLGGVFGSFEGTMSNVSFNSLTDGVFEGSSGSFPLTFSGGPLYNGAIIVLETGRWFTNNFTNANTQVEASILPEPSALLLLAMGAAFARRR
ncbi:MAG: hypothetical protein JNG88_08165 [Phycisphaerales bacterium]|nr:hypothetical protein [Phycisphaerales bacterium]